jgi:hypothetical protein
MNKAETMDDLFMRMMRLGQQGYSCSQILLLLALEARGQSNPDLVRAMAGLAYGCGSSKASCGVLTGGCCLLAFWAVDEHQPEQPSAHLPVMLAELTDWVEEHIGSSHGGTTCDAIVGAAGPAASRQTCATLIADAYAKVIEILERYHLMEF